MKYWDEKEKKLLTQKELKKVTKAPAKTASSDESNNKTPAISSEEKKVSK